MSHYQPVIHLNNTSNEDFVAKYKQSLQWLKSLQKLNPSSRFEKYLKVVNELGELKRDENGLYSEVELTTIQQRFTPSVFDAAILEGQELIEIYNIFGTNDNSSEIPKQLLNDIVNGGDNYSQEGANSDPRNKLFELFCAAQLKKSGYKPKLTVTEDTPDISFSHNRFKVFVECKRFSSGDAFKRNLKKAYQQLNKALERHGKKNYLNQKAIGFVFMSTTKVINPNQAMLAANDIQIARSKIKNEILKLVLENKEILERTPDRIVGLLLFARIPVFIQEGYLNYRILKGFPLAKQEGGAWDAYMKITKRLSDSGMPR